MKRFFSILSMFLWVSITTESLAITMLAYILFVCKDEDPFSVTVLNVACLTAVITMTILIVGCIAATIDDIKKRKEKKNENTEQKEN